MTEQATRKLFRHTETAAPLTKIDFREQAFASLPLIFNRLSDQGSAPELDIAERLIDLSSIELAGELTWARYRDDAPASATAITRTHVEGSPELRYLLRQGLVDRQEGRTTKSSACRGSRFADAVTAAGTKK
jgi:hypothetical protein